MNRRSQYVRDFRMVEADVSAGACDAEGNGSEPRGTIPLAHPAQSDVPDPLPPDDPRYAIRRSARLAA